MIGVTWLWEQIENISIGVMATLTIRELDEKTKARLRVRAGTAEAPWEGSVRSFAEL